MKTVMITGASSGIGREFARAYARKGYRLILCARREDRLKELAEEVKTESILLTADLSREEECYDLLNKVRDEDIDIFINNAGFGTAGEFLDTDLNKEITMVKVNDIAMQILMKGMLQKMQKRGGGTVLNVASSAGLFPAGPYMATYYASKAYILSLTRAVARELKEKKLDATGAMSDASGKPTIKEPWNMTEKDVEACLAATNWMPADRDYFRGGGYSAHFVTREGMPMTMMRLNIVAGLGPVLQIAEGWTAELPKDMHDILDKRTDPTWPTTWFVPRLDASKDCFKDVYSVMNNWGANHGAIAYGHIGADLITLASILRIPVCMHNVPEDKIFRPAAWNAFGMDKEGADYRACANFGPIYK